MDNHSTESLLVQNVGAYKVLKTLQTSKYGTVCLGSDSESGKKVVIKIFDKPDKLSGVEEIEVTMSVDHAHLAKYIDNGKVLIKNEDGIEFEVNYLVVEYYPKFDLIDIVTKSGKFSEDLARYYMRQLVSAVQHFYEKGFMHRDIKLENILLDDDFNLKLVDFGYATANNQMLHKLKCGSLPYMAPEVNLDKEYKGE